MLEGVADSMAYVILRNETRMGVLDGESAEGSQPDVSKAALVILVFEAFRSHPLGYVGFLVFLTMWTTLALPVTPIEVCAGCVFGPVWGTLGSLTGKTLGCVVALFIGRFMGKSQGWKMPSALDKYLGLLKNRPFEVSTHAPSNMCCVPHPSFALTGDARAFAWHDSSERSCVAADNVRHSHSTDSSWGEELWTEPCAVPERQRPSSGVCLVVLTGGNSSLSGVGLDRAWGK